MVDICHEKYHFDIDSDDFLISPPLERGRNSLGQVSLTFTPGDTSQCFTVTVLNDTLEEPTEFLTLTINSTQSLVAGPPIMILNTGNKTCFVMH